MHVVAAYESGLSIEITLAKLKEHDIGDHRIIFIEMEKTDENGPIADTMHRSDGIGRFDSIAAWAAVGGTLGCIYGFVITLGPIMLGLAGTFLGAAVGFFLDMLIHRKHSRPNSFRGKENLIDLLLVVHCSSKDELHEVMSICRKNNAIYLGVHDEVV